MLLANIASELRWRLYECVGPSPEPERPARTPNLPSRFAAASGQKRTPT